MRFQSAGYNWHFWRQLQGTVRYKFQLAACAKLKSAWSETWTMSQRQQNFTRSYPQFHQNTFTDGRKCTVVLRTADRYQNDFPVSVFRLTISFYNVFSSSYRFTQIAVDPQVKVPGGKTYDVLFIGTGNYWKRQKAYKFNSAKPINLIGFLFGFISTTSLFQQYLLVTGIYYTKCLVYSVGLTTN